jgi:hypothetical protein
VTGTNLKADLQLIRSSLPTFVPVPILLNSFSRFRGSISFSFEASRGSETKPRDELGSGRKVDSGNPDALPCTTDCALCSGGILGFIRDESGNPI